MKKTIKGLLIASLCVMGLEAGAQQEFQEDVLITNNKKLDIKTHGGIELYFSGGTAANIVGSQNLGITTTGYLQLGSSGNYDGIIVRNNPVSSGGNGRNTVGIGNSRGYRMLHVTATEGDNHDDAQLRLENRGSIADNFSDIGHHNDASGGKGIAFWPGGSDQQMAMRVGETNVEVNKVLNAQSDIVIAQARKLNVETSTAPEVYFTGSDDANIWSKDSELKIRSDHGIDLDGTTKVVGNTHSLTVGENSYGTELISTGKLLLNYGTGNEVEVGRANTHSKFKVWGPTYLNSSLNLLGTTNNINFNSADGSTTNGSMVHDGTDMTISSNGVLNLNAQSVKINGKLEAGFDIGLEYTDGNSHSGIRQNGVTTEYYNNVTTSSLNVVHEFLGFGDKKLLSITQGGQIGIGTANPKSGYPLTIRNINNVSNASIRLENDALNSENPVYGALNLQQNGNMLMIASGNNDIQLMSNSKIGFKLQEDHQVAIGDVHSSSFNAERALHVAESSNAQIRLERTGDNSGHSDIGHNDKGGLGFYPNGYSLANEVLLLKSDLIELKRDVNISENLHVNGTTVIGNPNLHLSFGDQTDMRTEGNYNLIVENGILTEKVKVAIKTKADWRDMVFEENYDLKSLDAVESYIDQNGHLPDVPSAEEVVKNGVDIAKMDATLLQKIEELTLYMIQMKKQNEALQSRISELEKSK